MEIPETAVAESAPPAPAMERVTDEVDSAASIISDLRDHFEAEAPAETPAEAPQPEPAAPPVAEPPAETPAEAPPPVEEPETLPPPESTLAPFFTLATLPAAEALPQAVDTVRALHAYDPDALKLLVNAVFQSAPKTFETWVLDDLGLTPEQIPAFKQWVENGSPAALPLGAFPEPEKDGEYAGWVTLPNGVQIDTTTPEGRERYETQKALHELKAEKEQSLAAQQKAAAEQNAQAEAARAAQEIQVQEGRVADYVNSQYSVRDALINEAVGSLAEGDKFFGDMFRAMVVQHIDSHPEIQQIGQEANRHVLAGTGRVPEFARRHEAVIRREVNTLRQDFSRAMLRVNRAEIAATATAPRVPPGTQRVEVGTPPPANGERQPQSIDELLAEARQWDAARFGTRR